MRSLSQIGATRTPRGWRWRRLTRYDLHDLGQEAFEVLVVPIYFQPHRSQLGRRAITLGKGDQRRRFQTQ